MRKALPEKMFSDAEQSRLTLLRNWVLDGEVTEIEMNERQFWHFAPLQPAAAKPRMCPICLASNTMIATPAGATTPFPVATSSAANSELVP